MSYFQSSDELKQILGGFFETMQTDSDFGPRVRAAEVFVTFFLSDPDLEITVDGVNPAPDGLAFALHYGAPPAVAPLSLTLSADTAHVFWQGRLNVMMALAQQQIAIAGSVGKVFTLLPVVQPAFERYRAYLAEIGRADLLV